MRAAQQGTLDGLCGVYAVVNALELAGVAGRRSSMHKELFAQLNYGLGAVALLTGLNEGLDVGELMRAADVAFQWLAHTYSIHLGIGRPFERRRFRSMSKYVEALQTLTVTPNTAVIISFQMPGMSHWSVVRSITDEVIWLRDSGRMAKLQVDEFALTRGPCSFAPEDTLVVKLEAEAPW